MMQSNGPTTPTATASPLAEADPASLDEFMSRDPAGMTDAELDAQVAIYRRMRAIWEKSAAKARNAPKSPRGAKAKTTLGDLGLDD